MKMRHHDPKSLVWPHAGTSYPFRGHKRQRPMYPTPLAPTKPLRKGSTWMDQKPDF